MLCLQCHVKMLIWMKECNCLIKSRNSAQEDACPWDHDRLCVAPHQNEVTEDNKGASAVCLLHPYRTNSSIDLHPARHGSCSPTSSPPLPELRPFTTADTNCSDHDASTSLPNHCSPSLWLVAPCCRSIPPTSHQHRRLVNSQDIPLQPEVPKIPNPEPNP